MLTWTKTDSGYISGAFTLTKTPGRRWIVTHNDEQIGAQVGTLADAKTRAENFEPVTEPDTVLEPTPVAPVETDALGYPVGQTALTPADWGIAETATDPGRPIPPNTPTPSAPVPPPNPRPAPPVPRPVPVGLNTFDKLYLLRDLGYRAGHTARGGTPYRRRAA